MYKAVAGNKKEYIDHFRKEAAKTGKEFMEYDIPEIEARFQVHTFAEKVRLSNYVKKATQWTHEAIVK